MAWINPTTLQLTDPSVPAHLGSDVVRLVPLGLEHAEALWEAIEQTRAAEVLRYQPTRPPTTLSQMRDLLALRLEMQAKGDTIPFTIVHRREPAWPGMEHLAGRPIGVTCYLDIQPANRALEIGATWIGPRWQRTRVNTECKYILLRHAFETLGPSEGAAGGGNDAGAVRVYLRGDARNQRSLNAVLRLGATYEGTLRGSRIVWDGFCRDTWYASIIRPEWPGVKARLESLLASNKPE